MTQAQALQELINLAGKGAPLPNLEGESRQIEAAGLTLEYSKSRVDERSIAALEQAAEKKDLQSRFAALFSGEKINFTEQRAALHVRLRDPDANDEVKKEIERMLAFADAIASGEHRLPSGEPVKAIVHIGIGGSFLGPKLYYEALPCEIECRFVANIDPAAVSDALAGLQPAETLFICASKSGTTSETLANIKQARSWLENAGLQPNGHFAAVSSKASFGVQIGAAAEQRFAMWDWVGGRYSIWSPVSVSVAAAGGVAAFRQFLAGAHEMDKHVRSSSGFANMAVVLALLDLWHSLALDAQSHCVVAYQHRLRSLPAYLQQLVMESNGKSTTEAAGRPAAPSSSIWWGGEGTNDQHSYYQLLLQGMHKVPCDFIFAARAAPSEDGDMQRNLLANVLGQSRALMLGRDLEESKNQLIADGMDEKSAADLAPHLVVPGGQPSNLIYFQQLSPAVLGALIALYEHATSASGWLLGINSFDQWGVELGKINFRKVLHAMEQDDCSSLDSVTAALIKKLG